MSSDGERTFLHDCANSLSVACGNLKLVLRKIELNTEPTAEAVEIKGRAAKAMEACEKMVQLIIARRQQIESEKNPN
ncbi:MAG: hypothetical protein NTX25_19280 [Proteobacteria bacterium]|nr:hypothetical protein [Pseudomonadota bacterium]